MTSYRADFEPVGRRGECHRDESLLASAQKLGVSINSVCGGRGTCHSCKIRVLEGAVSPATGHESDCFSAEELKEGWRLACQAWPHSDCKLNVPAESLSSPQRAQVEGQEVVVAPEPAVVACHLRLPPPTLADSRADAERLLAALRHDFPQIRLDTAVLRVISPRLRAWGWECQVALRHDEVVALGPWPSRHLGLAVDLGTTKIAGYLVDLSDGQTLASQGTSNPQISYGEDIITRLTSAAKSPEDAARLQRLVVEALNQLARDLCARAGSAPEDIVDAVVVGNTAMHHLFLGLPVGQLVASPFVPAVSGALDVKARDLGLLLAPGACVHLPPNIAGFVGSDHVAAVLATEAGPRAGPAVALDIGTNTEVSLISDGKLATVSCASGPAFEGGHIKDGMRAARGAIERVQLDGGEVRYQCIEDAPAAGICGSGVLDAVAQLFLAGVIDERGRLKEDHPRVRVNRKQREFVLVEEGPEGRPAIVLTQQDIREVQLAKAAIRAGIDILLETEHCPQDAVRQVILAGAFGSYIDVASAVAIGMLPPLPRERFQQVGNAAGMGAKLMLTSVRQRAGGQAIASRARYVELATSSGFRTAFLRACSLRQQEVQPA